MSEKFADVLICRVFDVLSDGKKHSAKELGEKCGVDADLMWRILKFGDLYEFLRFDKKASEAWMSPKMSEDWRSLAEKVNKK